MRGEREMKLNTWCKENNTYYSVISNMIKKGKFPTEFYSTVEGKTVIENPEEASKWYQSYKSTKVKGSSKNVVAATDESTNTRKVVREGDFAKRDVPIPSSRKKRVKIEQVKSVSDYLIQTDDGLEHMHQPWTHQGFDEGHVITTPKAIVDLLIKEFTCRERPDVVDKLRAAKEQMDKFYDEDLEKEEAECV